MKSVNTLEEAIQICEEHLLNIQYELDLEKAERGQNCTFVRVSSNPSKTYKGENLITAINGFLKDIERDKKVQNDTLSAEEIYNNNLYCLQCGEDDKANFAFINSFADSDEYRCKNCDELFQIPSKRE